MRIETLALRPKAEFSDFKINQANCLRSIFHLLRHNSLSQSHFGIWKMSLYSAGTRTFVQEEIFDAFVAEATKLAQARKLGCPFDLTVHQGLLNTVFKSLK